MSELIIRQIPAEPAQPAEPPEVVAIDVYPAVLGVEIKPVISTPAPAEPASTDEPAAPAPEPEPRVWPVPSDESIGAYYRVYQQAQLHLLDRFSGSYDPEMLDKQLSGANVALREAWQVWRQTAQPLSIQDADNFLRRTGLNHLAEARFGQGVAGMTIIAFEPGLNGVKLPVYGVHQKYAGRADDDAIDEIRAAWRAKVAQAFSFALERLRVYGYPADALSLAMAGTLP